MSKLLDKFLLVAISAVLAIAAVGHAKAATWIVTDVLQVSDGGFGASSFHHAGGSNVMAGSSLGTIANTAVSGSYNDVTGAFSFSAGVTGNAGGANQLFASATSGFLFNGAGELASNNVLDLSFASDFTLKSGAVVGAGTTTEMGFKLGDVCCSGSADPNSFVQPDADGDMRWITLWGANDFNTATGTYGSSATIGMDMRIVLERSTTTVEVPEPAVNAILGLGLLGLAYARRKKTV